MTGRTFAIFGGILASAVVLACAWDRDTLQYEAEGLPGAMEAIVGAIDRNPDLYYEMRLDRVEKLLEENDSHLDLYDDAAIACDKLGRGEEALAWLDKKWVLMESMDLPGDSDATYKYWANLGTVRVHHWIRGGAKLEDVEQLDLAISEIEKALEINPEAHFGREEAQLTIMKMMRLDLESDEAKKREAAELWLEYGGSKEPQEVVDAIIGMMVMGGGWESPDLIQLMVSQDGFWDKRPIVFSANKRVEELAEAGKLPLLSEQLLKMVSVEEMIEDERVRYLTKEYDGWRDFGREYSNYRADFMMAQLSAGKHPDTDGDAFWEGYDPPIAPQEEPPKDLKDIPGYLPLTIALAGLVVLVVVIIWQKRSTPWRAVD